MKSLILTTVFTFLFIFLFLVFAPTKTQAALCDPYYQPRVLVTCPTDGCRQGGSVDVYVQNVSGDPIAYTVSMSVTSDPLGEMPVKVPETTLNLDEDKTHQVPIASNSVLGNHYIRVTSYHRDPDCLIGSQDRTIIVQAASGSDDQPPANGDGDQPPANGDGDTSPPVEPPVVGNITFPWQVTVNSIEGLLAAIISWLLGLAGGLALIAIVYSGIMYIMAGPDPTKAEAAKKNLLWAVLGVIIIVLSYVIVQWVIIVLTTNPS